MDPEENLLGLLGLSQEDVNNEINGIAKTATGQPATASTKVIAKKYAEKKLKQTFVDRNLTKGQRFIMANFNKLTEQTQTTINKGLAKFRDGNYYVRKNIAGGSEMGLIDDSLTKLSGVSNISKGKLPDGVNLAVTRIELNYDNSTLLTSADVKKADFRPIASGNTDPALENGELKISLDGTVALTLPINQINKQEPNTNGPANGFNLGSPFLITEAQTIEIKIICSDGQTLDAGSSKVHFVDAILKGDELGRR